MSTPRSWLEAARRGDRWALAGLVNRYRGTRDEAAAVLLEPFGVGRVRPVAVALRAARIYSTAPAEVRAALVARALALLDLAPPSALALGVAPAASAMPVAIARRRELPASQLDILAALDKEAGGEGVTGADLLRRVNAGRETEIVRPTFYQSCYRLEDLGLAVSSGSMHLARWRITAEGREALVAHALGVEDCTESPARPAEVFAMPADPPAGAWRTVTEHGHARRLTQHQRRILEELDGGAPEAGAELVRTLTTVAGAPMAFGTFVKARDRLVALGLVERNGTGRASTFALTAEGRLALGAGPRVRRQ